MRILLISRSWPSHEHSGVSLAAESHLRMLKEIGHEVSIVGSDPGLQNIKCDSSKSYYIYSRGTFALYSLPRIDLKALKTILLKESPDLVIVEAWQTVLTDCSIYMAYKHGFPVLMISHGVSLDPFLKGFKWRLRSLGWFHYKRFILPGLIKKLSMLTTLDEDAASSRFYDRDLARRIGVPVIMLPNSPVNYSNRQLPRNLRRMQIIVVGYYSAVKNQMGALDVAYSLRDYDVSLLFVGPKKGSYYSECVRKVEAMKLDKVIFADDQHCDLNREVGESILLLMTSVTEALPITLIEAMASGTPFVATPVGAVPSLAGGLMGQNTPDLTNQIKRLLNDRELWQQLSEAGFNQYKQQYTSAQVSAALARAVGMAVKAR